MKKIMFNDALGLTAAVLSGRKTMTRRVVSFSENDAAIYSNLTDAEREAMLPVIINRYSRYQVGERVAIAQAYKDVFLPGFFEHLPKSAINNKMFVKAETTMVLIMPVMTATVYAVILLISWVGAHMIVSDELTTGQLMSLLAYCMNILMSLMMLGIVFVMVTLSTASANRIAEVLTEESNLKNPDNPVFEVRDGSIDFNHAMFSYSEDSSEPVLKDIDIHIRPGETTGVIGGTGIAKSSLINLIPRLYDVNEGSVFVGGRDVREYDLESLRGKVAVVLQQNVLFSGTILENLRWGNPDATEEECMEACRMACADEFINRFPDGLNTMISQGGTNVSGGQKQRLCIARSLLRDPKILILDDSTSAVDTATDAKIRSAMAEAKPGMTRIIIAQRIVSVENADRVIVMENGQVNGFDTPDNLMKTNAIYREVYETQKEGSGDFDISAAATGETNQDSRKGGH